MGLFKSKEQRERERGERKQREQAVRTEGAKKYIAEEQIKCDSSIDLATLELVYDAFKKNLDIHTERYAFDDYDQLFADFAGEIESADANAFHFFKAIIYQNFMIMRKIDTLSKHIEQLGQ